MKIKLNKLNMMLVNNSVNISHKRAYHEVKKC